jgi:hypothetical protein
MGIAGGEDSAFWTIVIAGATMAINFVVAIASGVSTLNRARADTDEKIDAKDRQMTENILGLERLIKNEIDSTSRNVGETMLAMRTKITEVELFGRDHYVEKGTFQTFANDMRRSWERFEEKLDKRFDKIDNKLDQNSVTD